VLTPLLVASTTAAGRRWGPAVGGWLVALPLTSGPIALFIAIEQGSWVAQEAAAGSLVGASAQVAFAAAYALAARRVGWMASVVIAAGAFVALAFVIPPMPAASTYGLLVVLVATFLVAFRRRPGATAAPPAPKWDIPARVVVATVLVVTISALAPHVGGRPAGILATFPVYAAVLTTFAHPDRLRRAGRIVAGAASDRASRASRPG
jgi:hypothetical protein